MTRHSVLTHAADALANEGTLERSGRVIEIIARQFGYAGIEITADDLRTALDAVSEDHPSCFGPMPALSTHQGAWGLEYRFRPSTEVQDAHRACIDAVYAVTDTMDRTKHPTTLKDGSTVEIETTRPHAFAVAMGHLRVRWAKGNLTTPRPSTIKRWVGIA